MTQWCIEEAVFEQLAVVEARALAGTAEVELSSRSPLDADWMDRARRFAAGEDV